MGTDSSCQTAEVSHLRTKTHSLTKTLLCAVRVALWHLLPFHDTKLGAYLACRNEELWALKPCASTAASAPNPALGTGRVLVQ